MHPGRRLVLRLAGLLACRAALPARAGQTDLVHAILGPDSDRQRAIERALRSRFPRLQTSSAGDLPPIGLRPAAYVAVGPVAMLSALSSASAARLNAPLICTFASRQSFMRAVSSASVEVRATAIYAEPSPVQQMRLIASIYKRTVTVGALVSEQSALVAPLLRQAAAEHRLELDLASVDPDVSLSRNLLRLASATVLLIFPDSAIYTPASLRELLEATYRRRQPVVGFSESLVQAGTLASAYSGVDDTVAQLQSVVGAVAQGRLPAPQYPRYWRVAVNDSVARSMNVVVDDEVRQMGDRP